MTSGDAEPIWRRAKAGQVSNKELAEVAAGLERGAGADTYKLLYAIIRSDALEYEELVAGFIDYPRDPQVAALALRSLCVHWGKSGRYRDRIIEYLSGASWDYLDELRQAAISSAGEHLRLTSDRSMLEKLIEIAASNEADLNGRFALEALARALGEPHSTAIVPHDPDNGRQWTEDILSRANDRLADEHT